MRGRNCSCLLAICFLILPPVLSGQSESVDRAADLARAFPHAAPSAPQAQFAPPRPLPISPGTPVLPWMTRASGMIFSGTVTGVVRRPATGSQSIETVSITFHVEQALRGVTAGETLSISQWIGLWSSGQRYRVGERVLVFLYPPSKLGLTSCVSAPLGRFAVDPVGRVLLSAQHLSAFRTDPVLGGKSRVSLSDFALAVRQAGGEE